ncbi:ATP-binding protein [uncultured Sunxiuqinia sp.]|uniref:sensor histidine kinase n=1 Tax=uncultured Sunxiuqinia sp. TaxID=1573825 RepID=UPI002AA6ED43|nr:ATP-binding protein [uncultured Sunxiuqinia sp.]
MKETTTINERDKVRNNHLFTPSALSYVLINKHRPSLFLAFISIAGGLLVIAGWFFDWPLIKSLSPRFVSMKFNTALCFLFSGLAVFIFSFSKEKYYKYARLLAGLTSIIGVLTLLEYSFQINFGIDQMFVREAEGAVDTFSPGRMAFNTAVGFLLVGISLIINDFRAWFATVASQLISLVVTFISMFSTLGYVLSIPELFRFPGFSGMALHTSVLFFTVSLGTLFLYPHKGVLSVIFMKNLGGYMSRRLLPLLMIIPFLYIWLQLEWITGGFFRSILALQLLSAGIIGVFIFMVWKIANRVGKLEEDYMKALENISEANERFTLAVKASDLGVWDWHIESDTIFWNKNMFAFYGIEEKGGEDIRKIWIDFFHPEDREEQQALAQDAVAYGRNYEAEYRIIRVDGSVRYLKNIGEVLRDQANEPYRITGITFDMTEQRQVQKELEENEKKYRYLFDENPVPIWIIDERDLTFLEVNSSAVKHYGYTEYEFHRMTYKDIRPKEDVDLLVRMLRTGDISKHQGVWRHLKRNGEIMHVDVKGHKINYSGKPARLVICNDVTLQKEAEIKARLLSKELEERVKERTQELFESNKELESFAYSVSHDLRAPLRHVIGFAQKLERHLQYTGSSSETDRLMTKIKDSATKLGQLIDELLTFSRLGRADVNKSQIRMEQIVHEVINDYTIQYAKEKVDWNIQELPEIEADAVLLKSVYQNLINNSLKFSNKKEKIRIDVGYEENDKAYIFFVKDNGAGFSMEYADKLFGVFQRLHKSEDFSGTGIGLAIVRRIIKKHGGETWAEGQEGNGATFYFSVPK